MSTDTKLRNRKIEGHLRCLHVVWFRSKTISGVRAAQKCPTCKKPAEYSRAPGGSGNNQIPEIQRLKPLRAEERRWPVAWVRLWRRDMRDTAGIISDRTKLVSSRRPTSFGAPKTFDERRQERKIRCAVVLRTLERSGHARLSAHLHILLASYILIIMIRLTYLSRAFCSRTITPHLK